MNKLFAKCVQYDNNLKGRIGGNPPQIIEGQIPDEYKFYTTLVHPEKEDTMLSILIHEDFDNLLRNNIYPSIVIKVIEHKYSDIGNNVNKRILTLGLGSISEYTKIQEDEYLFVTIGGEPEFIQPKTFYYSELEKDGYSFFLQIDEEGYNDNLGYEKYVFMYGALYLYRHNITGEIIAGFWQCS
jgi:hypothetical protein